MKKITAAIALAFASTLTLTSAWAQEFKAEALNKTKSAPIIANLAKNIPELGGAEEIRTTPINDLYEIRIGKNIVYANAAGTYFVNGHILDSKTKRNFTQERIEQLNAVDFNSFPINDAIKTVQGKGTHKIIVFADPNCGYCKQFERVLAQVPDITVYTFMIPILGPNSVEKSNNIWCAKDRSKTMKDWMINGIVPTAPKVKCDTEAITRNLEMANKYEVRGTPNLVFEDGTRSAGALDLAELNKRLAKAKATISAKKK